MNKSIQLIVSLLAAGLLLAAGAAQAAKVPKVEVCHLDQDAGIFLLKSVSGNALEPHLNHGDLLPDVDNGDGEISLDGDCMLVLPPHVLARAYIDVDDDGAGYDAEQDIDIAILTDTNNDGVVSAGDEVEVDAFPTTFDPCDTPQSCPRVGSFDANNITVVSAVLLTTTEHVQVETSQGIRHSFASNAGIQAYLSRDNDVSTPNIAGFDDHILPDVGLCLLEHLHDLIEASTAAVEPTPEVGRITSCRIADDPFVDVEITPAP